MHIEKIGISSSFHGAREAQLAKNCQRLSDLRVEYVMPSAKKTDPVTLRLTSEEKGQLVKSARALGISVSEFCRRGIFKEGGVDPEEPSSSAIRAQNKRKSRH